MEKEDSDLSKLHVSGQANKPMTRPAHALGYDQLVFELGSDGIHGLSGNVAKQRLDELGENGLHGSKGVSAWKIIVAQVANAMTMVLILAMTVSYGIGSYIEGAVVTAVILLNVIVGFFQEYSAEKTMDSLRSLSSPTASIVRDRNSSIISAAEVVMGDLVELKTGDTVPAGIRIIEAVNFETDEALLTGESLPVRKDEKATYDDNTGPGDRLNVAFSSSTVTKGRAKGIVFATGTYTEIGAITAALRQKDSKVRHVKRNPDGSTKPYRYPEAHTLTLTDAIGRFLGEVIIYAVATGLSMIPASLVVVLTITIAAGTKRMVQRNVIVRNLQSLEALGAITDICSDKTGTLTQGKMVARRAWIPAMGTYTEQIQRVVVDRISGNKGVIGREYDENKRFEGTRKMAMSLTGAIFIK
ncbi:E1-E2 ATPase-domain-containing protein [Hypoxylon cercidicola]|nr:E1-E2 ATPase-domain-containing protein [Hypoxylon cercidicola]